MKNCRIERLVLNNFRNHKSLVIDVNSNSIVISGPNGIGKTNVLEAISLLLPGKGLRNADHRSIPHNFDGENSWSVNAKVLNDGISSDILLSRSEEKVAFKIDGKNYPNKSFVSNCLDVMWLTPQMDMIFLDQSSVRRKFIDRIVFGFHPEHVSDIVRYEAAKNERMGVLKKGIYQDMWLAGLEEVMAQVGCKIIRSRIDVVNKIQNILRSSDLLFPSASIKLDGDIEEYLEGKEGDEAMSLYQEKLRERRVADANMKQTYMGPHKTNLSVSHDGLNMPAHLCSTGEQKLLLLSIMIATVRAKQSFQNISPIVLLDDTLSHLDKIYQNKFLSAMVRLNVQIWFSHTDYLAFEKYGSHFQSLVL